MIGLRDTETTAAGVRLSTPFTSCAYVVMPWTSISLKEHQHVGH